MPDRLQAVAETLHDSHKSAVANDQGTWNETAVTVVGFTLGKIHLPVLGSLYSLDLKDSPYILTYTVCPELNPILTRSFTVKPAMALRLEKFTTGLNAV